MKRYVWVKTPQQIQQYDSKCIIIEVFVAGGTEFWRYAGSGTCHPFKMSEWTGYDLREITV